MTSRERLTAAVSGERPDRIPWAPELNHYFIRKQFRKQGIDPKSFPNLYLAGNRLVGADMLMGISGVTPHYLATSYPYNDGRIRREVYRKDNREEIRIETPSGVLKQISVTDPVAQTTYVSEHLLKGPEDFKPYLEALESLTFAPDEAAVARQLEVIGEAGIPSLTTPETPIMSFIMYLMGIQETLYCVMDYPDECCEVFDRMHEKYKEFYRALASITVPVVRPFEDTSSSLTSPAMYARYALPYLKEYAAICHEQGKRFIPHMCGTLKDMLPVLRRADLDGGEALTPPPTGDAPAPLIRNLVGSEFVIIGGIDPTRFVVESHRIPDLAREALDSMRGDSRFILGHEEVPPDAPLEAVLEIPKLLETRRY